MSSYSGQQLAQVDNPDPFAPPVWRSPIYHTPGWVIVIVQAPRLKRGWELWLGNGWVTITSVRVSGEHVLIGAADGHTYRAG